MQRVRFGDFPELQPWIMGSVDQFAFQCEFGELERLEDLEEYDCIVPMTLHHYSVLSLHPRHARKKYLVPGPEVVALCDDKLAFNRYVAATEHSDLIPDFGEGQTGTFPYIVKRRSSERGIDSFIVENETAEERKRALLSGDEYFRQPYVRGHTEYALHLLVVRGEIVFSSTTRYVMNEDIYVLNRESRPASREVLSDSPHLGIFAPLIAKLGFEGTCCLDYKMVGDQLKLLEMNPRYGASLSADINRYLEAYIGVLDHKAGRSASGKSREFETRRVFGNSMINNRLRGDIEEISGRLIKGWVVNLADPLRPLDLDVFLDGNRVGSCRAGELRDHLRRASIGNGKYGFRFTLPRMTEPGEHEIDIRVHEASASVPGMPRRVSLGAIFLAGFVRHGNVVRGFAVPAGNGQKTPVGVACREAGRPDSVIVSADRRSGLAAALGLPVSCGFEIVLSGTSDTQDRDVEIWTTDSPERIRPLAEGHFLDGLVEGNVEVLGADEIRGWAWDPQHPGDQLEFEVCIDGKPICEGVAEDFRTDLLQAGRRGGFCGYAVSLPAKELAAKPVWLSLRAKGRELPFYVHPKPIILLAPIIRVWTADSAVIEGEAYVAKAPLVRVDLSLAIAGVDVPVVTETDHSFAVDVKALITTIGLAAKDLEYRLIFGDRVFASGRLGEPARVAPSTISSGVPVGRVAVITRTKDRPLLLERAIESVLGQTFGDWVHVIVNDGGEMGPVERLVARYADKYRGRLRVVHNPISAGMENASNIGILRSASEYVALLDDDDSWSPYFLDRCVDYLASAKRNEAGVVTLAMVIVEKIDGDEVQILQSSLFRDTRSISLSEIAEQNIFPNNSFVFKRSAIETVGYFDGDLPVLGDWDFNYRFVRRFDVGLIREPLAYYHQRLADTNKAAYLNTVVSQQDQHQAFHAKLMNKWMRNDMEAGGLSDGALLFMGSKTLDLKQQIEELRRRFDDSRH